LENKQEDNMTKRRITITPTKTSDGWQLRDENGATVADEGFAYPTRADAIRAAKQMYPTWSEWYGKETRRGWSINIQ
jgi:hypothetical protein